MWTKQIAGYIGPQETCVHEGRMAAAFNLPMISYVRLEEDNSRDSFFNDNFLFQFCTNQETSNKKNFPSFARTRPPDTQISKSIVSLLLAYNWTQVTFLYLDSNEDIYGAVAETIVSTLKKSGVKIRDVLTWNLDYHHGYMKNPFEDLVERTFMDTRSKLCINQ